MTVPSRTLSLTAAAAAAAASAVAYPFLPKRVPTRLGVNGVPDRLGSRVAAALTMPAVMAGMTLINDRLGSWPGGRDREDGASGVRARDEAIALVELALLPTHLAVLARGAGVPVDMSRVDRGIQGVLMIGLGNIAPKLPRNGLIGIRTPWTLADPAVWERTHRLGGYLLTAAGLVSLLSLPASGTAATRLPRTALLSAVGISVFYSLVAYLRRGRPNS